MALHATYQSLLLPASGAPVSLVPYITVAPSTFPKDDDSALFDNRAFQLVPDLRPYWSGDYQDRRFRRFIVRSHPQPMLDGEFIVYYSTSADKPANKTILDMPSVRDAIERSGVRVEDRLFYRGDVLVVRLGEVWEDVGFEERYEDVRGEMVAAVVEMLGERLFAPGWEEGFLERQRRDDAWFERLAIKERGMKEQLFAAM
ncbi:hypothetical protein P167DRAFT_239768 [Morchella conica CCBAS932]|uniref:Uncharacterized protein n=1 Tax=Morchella conica CCBAS932 TaxID=1392247 RepID=A0A3N4K702_9PEZI|nr:hypothetical protein P167DRAFT_239768 [Morchella conica CCBAS932]